MLAKEKQETLLDMPGMLKRLPDKGKSIVERIDALAASPEARASGRGTPLARCASR